MKNLYRCFALFFLLLFTACSPKQLRQEQWQVSVDTPDPMKPSDEFYTIGAGDALEVVVWKDPMLSGPVTVRPDGFITLPLINEVQVVGLTTSQLRETLETKYSEFVTSPFVTVRVTTIASNEIVLVGEVATPGVYSLVGNNTLLRLLARAGGLTPFADRDSIHVVRRSGEQVTEFIVDYNAIVEGDLKQDILLRPGDRVVVR